MPESTRPVLYVEDEEDDAMLMKLAFKRAGVSDRLHIAANGRQALDYLLGAHGFIDRAAFPLPSVVLLDLNLPELDGFAVLQQVRDRSELQKLPIVVFSSSAQPSDRERAAALGANDYVVKPSELDHLVAFARSLKETWLGPV